MLCNGAPVDSPLLPKKTALFYSLKPKVDVSPKWHNFHFNQAANITLDAFSCSEYIPPEKTAEKTTKNAPTAKNCKNIVRTCFD